MKKTQWIMVLLAGVVSFTSTFSVSWFLKKKRTAALAQQAAQQQQQNQDLAAAAPQDRGLRPFADAGIDRMRSRMSEQQLENLIYDVRSKLAECDERQKMMDAEEERIQISRQSLQKDIEHFNNLRDKLNIALTDIREKEESLKRHITEIDTLEKANFQRLASTYEKMDSAQAGRIIVSMADSNQWQDPVKILYYMNERMAGKLLSEIAALKPELASLLCSKLKLVKETE